MKRKLQDRLNQIPDKVVSDEFLSSKGLGNEIGFWIFDYSPEDEVPVKEYIYFLKQTLALKKPNLKVGHIDLFEAIVSYLKARGFMSKAIDLQKAKGDTALRKALSGPLHMDKLAPFFVSEIKADEQDVVFISGIGSAWPLVRAHDVLNSLHALLGQTPVVLFYPGYYDGQSMKLFDLVPSDNYYRAFKLIP